MPPTARLSRRAFGSLLAAASVALSAVSAVAGPEVYTGTLSNIAADGFDVVAFHREGRPVPGNARFTHRWKDATWRFASADARDAFAADPDRYAPAYGGHCSWAASQGYRASGDPWHWRIVDGRLFFNYDARVHRTWLADVPGFVAAADRNWPRILR